MSVKDQEGFPPHLIDSSIDEKRQYFADYAVAHTVLNDVHARLISSIRHPYGKQLIFVIGPPGVGKTFLLRWAEDDLREMWRAEQETDRGRIPVVSIEVPSRDTHKPTPKDIYLRVLRALEEPLITQKIIHGDVVMHHNGDGRAVVDSRVTTFRLRYAMEQALKQRRPFALFIDEAQHLFNIAGLALPEIMDWIKSIANMSGVLIVLYGTYEMFEMLDLSDQLIRRSLIIHLRRYGGGNADRVAFLSAINAFQKNMPLSQEPDLLPHWAYLYERTAGCIGNLYDWLAGAYNLALCDSAATVTLKDLKSTVPLSTKRAATMCQNITKDEANLIGLIGEDDAEPRMSDNASKKGTSKGASQGVGSEVLRKSTQVAAPRQSRVGERKPGRDKIGGTGNAE